MASSYSTDLKIELMVTGENAGTWGDKTNDNLNVIQQAIAGYGEQSIAGGAQTTALTIANSPTLSVARNIVIKLTGTITGNQIVTIPSGIEKTWIVSNGTTGAFTVEFKTTGGTGATWSATDKGIKILYSDGTNINSADLSTLSGTVASASIANLAVTSSKLASFAVTEARLASYAVTTSRLATNAVTAVKITQSTITQAKLASSSVGGAQIIQSTITQSKLAANSVGSNQLISTGVTAATYTSATITVDADGRITAASSGSAGGSMGVLTRFASGPASGTHTANPAATRLGIYMAAGGGGGQPNTGGGPGGYGFYDKPISQPFSQPFSISGGAGGFSNAGQSNFTNVGTVNGGMAGGAGTAPGSAVPFGGAGFIFAQNFIDGGSGGESIGSGKSGGLAIYENIGT